MIYSTMVSPDKYYIKRGISCQVLHLAISTGSSDKDSGIDMDSGFCWIHRLENSNVLVYPLHIYINNVYIYI